MLIGERGFREEPGRGVVGQDESTALEQLLARGDVEAIEERLQSDLRGAPRSPAALRNLGVFLGAKGDWQQAAALLGQAVKRGPEDVTIPGDYAHALTQSGRWEEGIRVLRRALRRWPEAAGLRLRLAKAYARQGKTEAAVEQCRLCGPLPKALRLEGSILAKASMYHRARETWRELFRVVEPSRQDWATMAAFEWHSGNAQASVEIARRLRAEAPVPHFFASTEITGRLHLEDEDRESIRGAVEEWDRIYAPVFAKPQAATNGAMVARSKRGRRLRIGYVSQEFHAGPAIHFILPLLQQRDKARFEIAVYHCGRANDRWTKLSRRHADAWRHMDRLEDLRQTIREDGVDVLVDLSGHYGSHLALFQERLAPLQITIPNCPCSTGVREMHYILSDRWVCPVGSERQYTEKAHWLASGYLAYRPPARLRVGPSPCEEKGYVTFGFFQRPTKLNARVWDAFAAILREVKKSRLLMQHACADLRDPGSPACRTFGEELAKRGVAPERLRFEGPLPLEEHLRMAGSVDIALDSFPYNGQTTACECLWMGVPVVTLAGETHVARVGWQLVDRIGCGELTAFTEGDYVRLAVELAQDQRRLRKYRRELRPRVLASPLMNGSVVSDMEAAFARLARR